mmetsp:Transcript_19445/g.77615  ORF Transcript_19445/g.77615 Transcript_19445/m.77615 type:complete len:129 (-) Transcript_19445:340-726(-)
MQNKKTAGPQKSGKVCELKGTKLGLGFIPRSSQIVEASTATAAIAKKKQAFPKTDQNARCFHVLTQLRKMKQGSIIKMTCVVPMSKISENRPPINVKYPAHAPKHERNVAALTVTDHFCPKSSPATSA